LKNPEGMNFYSSHYYQHNGNEEKGESKGIFPFSPYTYEKGEKRNLFLGDLLADEEKGESKESFPFSPFTHENEEKCNKSLNFPISSF